MMDIYLEVQKSIIRGHVNQLYFKGMYSAGLLGKYRKE